MRATDLIEEWQELKDKTSWPKHLACGFALFIVLINYVFHPQLSTIIHFISCFLAYMIILITFNRQEKKRYNYIYNIWEKGNSDIRYKICLETLYDCNQGLEPYAVKVQNRQGYSIIPFDIFNSDDPFF